MPSIMSIDEISNQIYERQKKNGIWNNPESPGLELEDVSGFFLNLHLQVSEAYARYQNHVLNEEDVAGIEMLREEGSSVDLPAGLPIDLGAIVFDVLGFLKRIGVDPSRVLSQMAECQKKYYEESLDDTNDQKIQKS